MPSNGNKPEQTGFCADREGIRKSARTAQPLSQDAEYMRRLEDEFREANPEHAMT
jgi:hypothetical protein